MSYPYFLYLFKKNLNVKNKSMFQFEQTQRTTLTQYLTRTHVFSLDPTWFYCIQNKKGYHRLLYL